jgi:hypothetical protein
MLRVTTPIRPLPTAISRWTSRLRWLRWVDALLAWLAVLLALSVWLPPMSPQTTIVLATAVVLGALLIQRVRLAWRPVTAITTFLLSRGLRPGDRAWFVHGDDADLVLVTARHGIRVVVARPGHDSVEGMSVRRTRVLLLPAVL